MFIVYCLTVTILMITMRPEVNVKMLKETKYKRPTLLNHLTKLFLYALVYLLLYDCSTGSSRVRTSRGLGQSGIVARYYGSPVLGTET